MAIELVDTHCHIQSAGQTTGERATREKWAKIPERTPEVIIRAAEEAGVTRMVCVGCDLNDSRLAVNFVKDKPQAWASIAIHPHEAQHYVNDAAALNDFAALATAEKVVAIGECGLDYYYGHSPQADQAKILRFQIELALEYDLPMIFHVRDAFDDFWPIFNDYTGIKGVLHSFTDSRENLDIAISKGLYIGVNGISTFAKDAKQIDMYKRIPLSSLVLETDAPFLTPHPYRGTICEPYHIKVISDFLGGLRGEFPEALARETTRNARALFNLK